MSDLGLPTSEQLLPSSARLSASALRPAEMRWLWLSAGVSAVGHLCALAALAIAAGPAPIDWATTSGERIVVSAEVALSTPQPKLEVLAKLAERSPRPATSVATFETQTAELEELEVQPPLLLSDQGPRAAIEQATETAPKPKPSPAEEDQHEHETDAKKKQLEKQETNHTSDHPAESAVASFAPPPQQVGLSETVPASPLRNPLPVYPASAVRRAIEGVVVLRLTITVEGKVSQLEVATTSGHDALDRAAMTAVQQWRFRPARRDDEPVQWTTLLPVRYRLR